MEILRKWIALMVAGAFIGLTMAGLLAQSDVRPKYDDPSVIDPHACAQWGEQKGSRGLADGLYWKGPEMVCELMDLTDMSKPAKKVVLEGPVGDTWKSLDVGITFIEGKCSDHPDAACITAKNVRLTPNSEWIGLTSNITPTSRSLSLGGDSDVVRCHEFLHALGVSHHWEGGGCLDTNANDDKPSKVEIKVLQEAYGKRS